ncbi:MAPEG family protein [uncultured Sphingomonas sp.]|uniref:MAPEG family protein n=1 Tax=uncultured Sphingomonas sp. TaxID=158754 RepID=UPI0025D6A69F|nr:MAPEG family protein [uncultured Sphingomonas sp.]
MTETPVDPAKRAPATPLARAQAGVTRAMGIAVVVTVALALIGYAHGDAMMLEARGWTLGVALLTLGLWVAAAIGDVARRRFASASAIDGDDGVDPDVDAANAILRNTAEQALLAAIAYGALTLLDDHARVAVALFAACFSAGRLLFWSGYRDGAAARALGFGLTFYPSVAALLMAALALLR